MEHVRIFYLLSFLCSLVLCPLRLHRTTAAAAVRGGRYDTVYQCPAIMQLWRVEKAAQTRTLRTQNMLDTEPPGIGI